MSTVATPVPRYVERLARELEHHGLTHPSTLGVAARTLREALGQNAHKQREQIREGLQAWSRAKGDLDPEVVKLAEAAEGEKLAPETLAEVVEALRHRHVVASGLSMAWARASGSERIRESVEKLIGSADMGALNEEAETAEFLVEALEPTTGESLAQRGGGPVSDPTFEKLHPREPKGRVKGGKFATKPEAAKKGKKGGNASLKQIAEMLDKLGYDLGDAGVTDKMTPALKAAIRKAQHDFGIRVNGQVSTALRSALNSETKKRKARVPKGKVALSADEQRVTEASAVGNPSVANSPSSQTAGKGTNTPHGGALIPVIGSGLLGPFVEEYQYPTYPEMVPVLYALQQELVEAVEERKAAHEAGDAQAFTLAWSRERVLRGKIEEADYVERLHPRGRHGQWVEKLSSLKVGQSAEIGGVNVLKRGRFSFKVGDSGVVHGLDRAAGAVGKAAGKESGSGLEGPFTYRSGWKGYYDPKEGRYLGLDDVFMPRDFDPHTGANAMTRGVESTPSRKPPAQRFALKQLPSSEKPADFHTLSSAWVVIDRDTGEQIGDVHPNKNAARAAFKAQKKPGSKMSRRSGHDLLTEADVDTQLEEVKSSALPDLPNKPDKTNWVEKAGGLPKYIERIAKHLHSEKGMSVGHAIATAVNVVKKMCASGDTNFPGKQNVNAGSKAQACKAVAEWNAKKGKSKVSEAETLMQEARFVGLRPFYPSVEEAFLIAEWADLMETRDKLVEYGTFRAELHPRGRTGKFIDVLGKLDSISRGSRSPLTKALAAHPPGKAVTLKREVPVVSRGRKATPSRRPPVDHTMGRSDSDTKSVLSALGNRRGEGLAGPLVTSSGGKTRMVWKYEDFEGPDRSHTYPMAVEYDRSGAIKNVEKEVFGDSFTSSGGRHWDERERVRLGGKPTPTPKKIVHTPPNTAAWSEADWNAKSDRALRAMADAHDARASAAVVRRAVRIKNDPAFSERERGMRLKDLGHSESGRDREVRFGSDDELRSRIKRSVMMMLGDAPVTSIEVSDADVARYRQGASIDDLLKGGRRSTGSMKPPAGRVVGQGERDTLDTTPDLGGAQIHELADIIRRDWAKVNFGAAPYLDAMRSLGSSRDMYGADSGKSIIAYFLSNASSWRGPVAKSVKAELKKRLKESGESDLVRRIDRIEDAFEMRERHHDAGDARGYAAAHARLGALVESTLTAATRKKLPEGEFAIPPDRYPIHDEAHARNALARVSQHGTPEEKAKVRAAVKRRYPNIGKD